MSSKNIRLVTQYGDNIFIEHESRLSRFHLKDTSLPAETPVTLSFVHSYDKTSWLPIPDASAQTTVKPDGLIEFFLLFGTYPKDATMPPGVAHIMLPRQATSDTRVFPELEYRVHVGEQRLVFSGRLHLFSAWGDIIEKIGKEVFEQCIDDSDSTTVPAIDVYNAFKDKWDDLFANISDCPPFGTKLFLSIVRMAHIGGDAPTRLPAMFARCMLHGDPSRTTITRLFYTLVELIGRSKIVRQLFAEGYVAMMARHDVCLMKSEKVKKPATRFFFRLPRSPVGMPALVMELVDLDSSGMFVMRQPTPYITSAQMARAQGDPLIAFSWLRPSTHEKTIDELTWKDIIHVEKVTTTGFSMSFDRMPAFPVSWTYNDPLWWTATAGLRAY